MKTFLRWPGNKQRYLKHLLPMVPLEFNTYYEPFLGSGALFLYLQPSSWVLNDKNKDIIHLWNTVKNETSKIITQLKYIASYINKLSNEQKIIYCKKITASLNNREFDTKRASIFLAMIMCAYMGHIFVKNRYVFKTLEEKLFRNKPLYFSKQQYHHLLTEISMFLNDSKGSIHNKDYKEIMKKAKSEDFVFLDPPYIETHDYQFNYVKDENIKQDFIHELLNEVEKLNTRNVKWLMTQADTPFVRKMFEKYNIHSFKVFRLQGNCYKKELIIKNY